MSEPVRRSLGRGVHLTAVTTPKFNASCVSVNFILPLDAANAPGYAMLVHLLRRGCESYPDMKRLAAALDELYGARIEPYVRRRGGAQCVGFVCDVLDDRFAAGGESLLRGLTALLGALICAPVREGGAFRADWFEGERKNIIDRIGAQMNDKRLYAAKRAREIMFAGDAAGLSEFGTRESAEKLTNEGVYALYRRMLETAPVELFYCGPRSADEAGETLSHIFDGAARGEIRPVPVKMLQKPARAPEYVTETLDVTQGKLSLGLVCGMSAKDADWPALVVANTIFGGSTASKLFLKVREEMSLCYYASSALDKLTGTMAVNSGIEIASFATAKDEILRQLEDVKGGRFTDSEFDTAVKTVRANLLTAADAPLRMEEYYLTQAVGELPGSLESFAARVGRVTREEAAAAARRVSLDTVYFLTGKEGAK